MQSVSSEVRVDKGKYLRILCSGVTLVLFHVKNVPQLGKQKKHKCLFLHSEFELEGTRERQSGIMIRFQGTGSGNFVISLSHINSMHLLLGLLPQWEECWVLCRYYLLQFMDLLWWFERRIRVRTVMNCEHDDTKTSWPLAPMALGCSVTQIFIIRDTSKYLQIEQKYFT